jgi:DNA primase
MPDAADPVNRATPPDPSADGPIGGGEADVPDAVDLAGLPEGFGRYDRRRVDIVGLMTSELGPPKGRWVGSNTEPYWWTCPWHPDRNPSLEATPETGRWRCWTCGDEVKGDAIDLLKRTRGLDFFAAKDYIRKHHFIGPGPARPARGGATAGPGEAEEAAEKPSLFTWREIRPEIEYAPRRLWTSRGEADLDYLRSRGIRDETARAFGLGSYPPHPRTGDLAGVVIAWAGARLIKVRRRPGPDTSKYPKYLELYRSPPPCPPIYFPHYSPRPGATIIITEGEFDCMLIWQELMGRIPVFTVGSSGEPIPAEAIERLSVAGRIYIGTDGDKAGDKAARKWAEAFPAAVRVRPPAPYTDWTDSYLGGVDLKEFWCEAHRRAVRGG